MTDPFLTDPLGMLMVVLIVLAVSGCIAVLLEWDRPCS